MAVMEVTDDTFEEEVLKSDVPVLVDIWATWCGPCKMLSPIVDEVADEEKGIKVVKVDADSNEEICSKYGVRSIPTLLFIKNGEVVNQSVGAIPKEAVQELIKS